MGSRSPRVRLVGAVLGVRDERVVGGGHHLVVWADEAVRGAGADELRLYHAGLAAPSDLAALRRLCLAWR